jgi:hypothetical protein
VSRFRLENQVSIACRGFGWPLKKTEKQLIANSYVSNKVVAFNFAQEAELAVAA